MFQLLVSELKRCAPHATSEVGRLTVVIGDTDTQKTISLQTLEGPSGPVPAAKPDGLYSDTMGAIFVAG